MAEKSKLLKETSRDVGIKVKKGETPHISSSNWLRKLVFGYFKQLLIVYQSTKNGTILKILDPQHPPPGYKLGYN